MQKMMDRDENIMAVRGSLLYSFLSRLVFSTFLVTEHPEMMVFEGHCIPFSDRIAIVTYLIFS